MTNFKVCSITNNPEQFKVEMEAVFGPSKVLMWIVPKHESKTMVHLGFTLNGDYSVPQLRNMIPSYCTRYFNYDVSLM